MTETSLKDTNRRARIFCLAAILIVNAVVLYLNAFRTFNFFDMGSFLDGGWRLYRGQHPYRDFIMHTGPLHFYTLALFFKIFGFSKWTVLLHSLTTTSFMACAVFLTLKNKVPLAINSLTTLLTVSSFNWNFAHPWFDHTAFCFGILTLCFLLSQIPLNESKHPIVLGMACGVLAVLAFITKPNIGGILGLLFGIIFICSSSRFKTFGGYLLGVTIGSMVGLLLIKHPQMAFEQISEYARTEGVHRTEKFLKITSLFVNFYWVPFLIVQINLFFKFRKHFIFSLINTGVYFLAIFAAITGGIVDNVYIFLWGVQMAAAFFILYDLKNEPSSYNEKTLRNISIPALVVWSCVLIGLTLHQAIRLETWRYFIKDTLGTYVIQAKPLRGWRCHTKQGLPLDELVAFVSKIPKEQTVLNLTDMYIIDALTGRDSYRGTSMIYDGRAIPPQGKIADLVTKNIEIHPPDWIIADFGSYDDTFTNLKLSGFIAEKYKPVARSLMYLVFRRVR